MKEFSLACLILGFSLSCAAADEPKAKADKPAPSKTSDKAAADDPQGEPEAFLKGKGLRRVDPFFVLAEESKITTLIHGLDRLQRKVFDGQKQENLAAKTLDQKKAQIEEYLKQRITLRDQLNRASTVDLHNAIVRQLNDLGDRIALLDEEVHKGTTAKPARFGEQGSRGICRCVAGDPPVHQQDARSLCRLGRRPEDRRSG